MTGLPRYDVALWDHEGNVVRAWWDVDADELDDIREEYANDHEHVVVATEQDN